MIEVEYTRLIAAAVAAVLLGYALYVAAYVKHKNAVRDEINKREVATKDSGLAPYSSGEERIRIEKTGTWYMGYRLALLGLIVTSAAIGWVAAWAVGQDHILSWVEDCAVAFAGAVIGGLVMDKYIIHPIADGSFFERVEDPIVQRFLQDGVTFTPVKDEKRRIFAKRKQKKQAEKIAEAAVADIPPVIVTENPTPSIEKLTFDEKVKLIEELKKSL